MIVAFEDTQTTLLRIQAFSGRPEEFRLLIPDAMNDAEGVTMSVVTDAILSKGWLPNGFRTGAGYRIYEFTS